MSGPPPPHGYRFSQTPAVRMLQEAAHQRRVDDGGAFAAVFCQIALVNAIPPTPQAKPSPQQAIPPPKQAPTEHSPLPPPEQATPPPEQAPLPLPHQVEHCHRFYCPSQSHHPSQSNLCARCPFPLSPVLPNHCIFPTPEQAHHPPPPKQEKPPPPKQANQPFTEQGQPLPPKQAQPPPPKQAHQPFTK